jgi:hypothetical protein
VYPAARLPRKSNTFWAGGMEIDLAPGASSSEAPQAHETKQRACLRKTWLRVSTRSPLALRNKPAIELK